MQMSQRLLQPRAGERWLPDMDLNHDKQIQSLLCYRYTIGQTGAFKVAFRPAASRLQVGRAVSRVPGLARALDDVPGRHRPSASRFTFHASRTHAR